MKPLEEDGAGSVARRWAFLRRPVWIVVVAFTLRVGVAAELLARNQLSWRANEPSSIAAAMVQGHGFSSAFHDTNEPTAWLGPVYPTLLACIFRFFGIKTTASAFVAVSVYYILRSLTSAASFRCVL